MNYDVKCFGKSCKWFRKSAVIEKTEFGSSNDTNNNKIGHEKKFSIFLTKTMKITHFKTCFFDYFDHYALNQQPIKTKSHINTFYIELSLF